MQWSFEYRAQVVLRLARAEVRMADLMAQHGLSPETVQIWVDEFIDAAPECFDLPMRTRLTEQGLRGAQLHAQQSGRLEQVEPLDLLQGLSIYRQSGHVLFFHPHGVSQLWFSGGQIIDARSGALRREAALYRIATHDRGDFRVDVTGEQRPRRIERPTQALLLEAARRLDECRRLTERLPPTDIVLSTGTDILMTAGLGDEHLRVAQMFGDGATLGQVLERSPLGELETQQRVVELESADLLRPTGAVISADVPSQQRRASALRESQREVSRPVVAMSDTVVEPGLTPPRRRWIAAAASGGAAAVLTLVVMLGLGGEPPASADASTNAGRSEPAPLMVSGPAPPPCPDDMVYLPAEEPGDGSATAEALCIDRYEVTVAQYRSCAQRGDCSRPRADADWPYRQGRRRAHKRQRADASARCNAGRKGTADHPINCVDWEQANAYCRSQGQQLPSEAQWDRAARGVEGRRFPWGAAPPTPERVNACGPECTDRVPAYAESDGHVNTAPIGQMPAGATPQGVHALGGNVREWTRDGFALPAAEQNAAAGDQRVVRGGGFASTDRRTLSTEHRELLSIGERRPDLGFRCVAAPR